MAARVVKCSMVVVTQQQELSLCYDQIIPALMSTSPPQSSGTVHVLHDGNGVEIVKMNENVQ